MILLLSRPDFETALSDEARFDCLTKVTEEFWKYLGNDAGMNLLAPLAELMFLFSPTTTGDYLEEFTGKLLNDFAEAKLPVQVPLLALINRSIQYLKGEISTVTVENVVRIISTVYLRANNLYVEDHSNMAKPLLAVAASTIHTIISMVDSQNWLPIFKRQFLINTIVSVTHIGLQVCILYLRSSF